MSEYTIPDSWAPFIQEDSELFLAFLCIIFQFTYCSSEYHVLCSPLTVLLYVSPQLCFIINFPTLVSRRALSRGNVSF